MQVNQGTKQETGACDWCGKFVVVFLAPPKTDSALRKCAYDIYVDEGGRLVRGENDMFYTSGEHRCKVACSGCGRLVIIQGGRLYEKKPGDLDAADRSPHRCATT